MKSRCAFDSAMTSSSSSGAFAIDGGSRRSTSVANAKRIERSPKWFAPISSLYASASLPRPALTGEGSTPASRSSRIVETSDGAKPG